MSMMLIALAAAAQAAPAAPAAQSLGGPVVTGVCLLSREAIFANAKVAVAANARLQQLSREAEAEIVADRKPLEAEIQAFQNEAPKLSAEQRATRERTLQGKLQPIQAKAQQRNREIEATRAKALGSISEAAQPLIAAAYKTKGCGLLVDRTSVLGGNFANDLTAEVVRALDAKMATITFNREVLPAQPAAPASR